MFGKSFQGLKIESFTTALPVSVHLAESDYRSFLTSSDWSFSDSVALCGAFVRDGGGFEEARKKFEMTHSEESCEARFNEIVCVLATSRPGRLQWARAGPDDDKENHPPDSESKHDSAPRRSGRVRFPVERLDPREERGLETPSKEGKSSKTLNFPRCSPRFIKPEPTTPKQPITSVDSMIGSDSVQSAVRKARARLGKPRAMWQPPEYAEWHASKKRAWMRIADRPEQFYYKYLPPGESNLIGDWSDAESLRLLTVLENRPLDESDSHWGFLSMHIPGRTGEQCEARYNELKKDNRLDITIFQERVKPQKSDKMSKSKTARKRICRKERRLPKARSRVQKPKQCETPADDHLDHTVSDPTDEKPSDAGKKLIDDTLANVKTECVIQPEFKTIPDLETASSIVSATPIVQELLFEPPTSDCVLSSDLQHLLSSDTPPSSDSPLSSDLTMSSCVFPEASEIPEPITVSTKITPKSSSKKKKNSQCHVIIKLESESPDSELIPMDIDTEPPILAEPDLKSESDSTSDQEPRTGTNKECSGPSDDSVSDDSPLSESEDDIPSSSCSQSSGGAGRSQVVVCGRKRLYPLAEKKDTKKSDPERCGRARSRSAGATQNFRDKPPAPRSTPLRPSIPRTPVIMASATPSSPRTPVIMASVVASVRPCGVSVASPNTVVAGQARRLFAAPSSTSKRKNRDAHDRSASQPSSPAKRPKFVTSDSLAENGPNDKSASQHDTIGETKGNADISKVERCDDSTPSKKQNHPIGKKGNTPQSQPADQTTANKPPISKPANPSPKVPNNLSEVTKVSSQLSQSAEASHPKEINENLSGTNQSVVGLQSGSITRSGNSTNLVDLPPSRKNPTVISDRPVLLKIISDSVVKHDEKPPAESLLSSSAKSMKILIKSCSKSVKKQSHFRHAVSNSDVKVSLVLGSNTDKISLDKSKFSRESSESDQHADGRPCEVKGGVSSEIKFTTKEESGSELSGRHSPRINKNVSSHKSLAVAKDSKKSNDSSENIVGSVGGAAKTPPVRIPSPLPADPVPCKTISVASSIRSFQGLSVRRAPPAQPPLLATVHVAPPRPVSRAQTPLMADSQLLMLRSKVTQARVVGEPLQALHVSPRRLRTRTRRQLQGRSTPTAPLNAIPVSEKVALAHSLSNKFKAIATQLNHAGSSRTQHHQQKRHAPAPRHAPSTRAHAPIVDLKPRESPSSGKQATLTRPEYKDQPSEKQVEYLDQAPVVESPAKRRRLLKNALRSVISSKLSSNTINLCPPKSQNKRSRPTLAFPSMAKHARSGFCRPVPKAFKEASSKNFKPVLPSPLFGLSFVCEAVCLESKLEHEKKHHLVDLSDPASVGPLRLQQVDRAYRSRVFAKSFDIMHHYAVMPVRS
eukprot:114731_1